jgi:pSer/pThr/pTyr-binding forkhead associated (FHA) protein
MDSRVLDPSYDSSLEWPGDDENTEHANPLAPSTSQSAHSPPTFRFVVRETSILPRAQRLAVVEGYTEVQIGRDVAPPGSTIPRIRLKEMEVSKLHATIYWDDGRAEWGLVDMGSKHGTFHNRYHSGISPDTKGSRLSPPKAASMPRHLQHLDIFSVGSTMFVVHIHDDGFPCLECSRSSNDEIPLFATKPSTAPAHGKRKRDEEHSYLPSDKDPKKALSLLKKSLLSQRPGEKPNSDVAATWVDRSARRRAMNPPSPPLSRKQSFTPPPIHPTLRNTPTTPNPSTPEPVSSSNIGYRMLAKQGWTPGTSLGVSDDDTQHVIEPITVPSTSNRAGLGSLGAVPSSSQGVDWREEGRQRIWSRLDS